MAENPRTTTARDTDDSELIEGMTSEPDAVGGTSANALGRDVGSQDDMKVIDDPDGRTRPMKSDDIHADQARASHRGGKE